MGPVDATTELRQVCDVLAPCMSAAESSSTFWSPDDRDFTARDRANEVPLSAPEPSRLRDKTKTLAKVCDPNLQPSFVSAAHIGAYEPRRDLTPMRVDPTYRTIA